MVQKQAATGGLRDGPRGARLLYWAGAAVLRGLAGVCSVKVPSTQQTLPISPHHPQPPPDTHPHLSSEREQREREGAE